MEVWPNLRNCKFFSKTISILIIQSFLISNVTFAGPIQNKPDIAQKEASIINPANIVIEKDAGLIKSKFIGNTGKLIINIQDAHCNYEAQTNIVSILETLIKNHSLSLISVEGADGLIDTTWFKAFPDEDVRKEVATYFMKKGEITGPEFLSITKNYPVKLFGAENRAYYIQNLNAFTSSYPLKADTEKYYNSIKNALNRIKGYIYSDDLKSMDAKSQDYESKKLQFNDYVRFLQGIADRQKINLRSYENFFRLLSVLIYEKKIDFNVTDKERSNLIDELSKALAKDALAEMVSQSINFKSGKISSVEFYNFLKKAALDNNIDLSKKYPNLYNYIIYNSVYAKIDNEKLFQDIKIVENAIKEKLFTNDDQRTLDKLSRHIDILLGMVNIKLLNGDFNYYQTHKDEFTHKAFTDFIRKKAEQFGLAYDVEEPTDAVANSVPKLEDFYSIATKRDKALVDNTLKEMDREGQQIAVLVTGGFHSEGMTRLLEKQGVSYIVVCPSITKDTPTPYIQILTNQRTPIEDILTNSPDAAKKGMLAPPLISELVIMEPKEAKTFHADGRAAEFKGTWLSQAIENWFKKALPLVRNDKLARDMSTMKSAYITGMRISLAGYIRQEMISQTGKIDNDHAAQISREANKIVDQITKTDEFNAAFERAFKKMVPASGIGVIGGGASSSAPKERTPSRTNLDRIVPAMEADPLTAADRDARNVMRDVVGSFGTSRRFMPDQDTPKGFLNPAAFINWGAIHVTIGAAIPLKGEALPQFITKIQEITISYNGANLKGRLYEIEGKTYVQYGDRWVTVKEFGVKSGIPLHGVIDGQLLLGNPSLQRLLGLGHVSLAQATQPLPTGVETVVELKNLFTNEYLPGDRQRAIEIIQDTNLLALAKAGTLDDQTFIDYLDALIVVSHEKVSAYKEFIGGVSRLKMLRAIAPRLQVFHVDPKLMNAIPGLLNFATKRKMTYPKPLLDLIAEKPSLRRFVKAVPDGYRTIIGPDGTIREADVANEVNWANDFDVAKLEAELPQDAAKAGLSPKNYTALFKVAVEIGIAGEGSRILENHLRLNKMLGHMVQVVPGHEEQVLAFFREMGFKHFQLYEMGTDKYDRPLHYIGITHLVLAKNPGAILIAGMSTIEPSEEWVIDVMRDVLVKTQDMANALRLDGSLIEEDLGIAGHGRLVTAMMESQQDMAAMIADGKIWRHVQGDDFGNVLVGNLMARAVRMGKTPMAVLTTPQAVSFTSNLGKISAWKKAGRGVTENGTKIIKVSEEDQIIYFQRSNVIDVGKEMRKLEQALAEVEELKKKAMSLRGQAQRDMWIEAMQTYQDRIFNVVKSLRFESGEADSDKTPLFTIIKNAGGHLLEADGVNIFVEQSNYPANVTMKDSAGKDHVFDREVFLAIVPKNFNTNNFCIDPLAVAANRDRRIKAAYHDYLRYAQAHQDDTDAVIEKRKEAEAYAKNIIEKEISAEEWEARTMALERLMISILPPPVELKGKGDKSYIKLNMMAQDVASFESMLALSQITAEDVDLANLGSVLDQASAPEIFADRTKAKNGLFRDRKGRVLNFAPANGLTSQRIMIIQVPETYFTQVKTSEQYPEFVRIVNQVFLKEGRGTVFAPTFNPIGVTQIQGANLQEWAGKAREYGIIGPHTAYKLKETGNMIARYGDKLDDSFPEMSRKAYANDIELMHRLRELIYKEDYGTIFAWSEYCEKRGENLTTDDMKEFLHVALNPTFASTQTADIYKYIIEGDRKVTVIDIAMRLGITESMAISVLQYLASAEAERGEFKGIVKKITEDGREVYCHIDLKPADMGNAYVLIQAGGRNRGMVRGLIAAAVGAGIPLNRILIGTKQEILDEVHGYLPAGYPENNIIIEPPVYSSVAGVSFGLKTVEMRYGADKVVIIMPGENSIGNDYAKVREALENAIQAAQNGDAIVAIGVQPKGADTQLGYIKYAEMSKVGNNNFVVQSFVEKPEPIQAERLANSENTLVNTAILVMKSGVGLEVLSSVSPDVARWLTAISELQPGVSLPSLSDRSAVSLKETFSTILIHANRFTTVKADFNWQRNPSYAVGAAKAAGTQNIRAALNQPANRIPIGKVLKMAQEYELMKPNAYAYIYDIGDITWWSQQNITEAQLRIEFATRQTIRNRATEQRYKVSLPSGRMTTGALSWWAEQLRDHNKTEAQAVAEFASLARTQPALIAQVQALRARPGAIVDDENLVSQMALEAAPGQISLFDNSIYSWRFTGYDIEWWANWGLLPGEMTAQFNARKIIRTLADQAKFEVRDSYNVINAAALSYWANQLLSGAMTQDQIRAYFEENAASGNFAAPAIFGTLEETKGLLGSLANAAGAIRLNGGELTPAEHGPRASSTGVENARVVNKEETVNGAIEKLILAGTGKARSLRSYQKLGLPGIENDATMPQLTAAGLPAALRDNFNALISRIDNERLKVNVVVIQGLKAELGAAKDIILHPGITRRSAYIDEDDFKYLLSLPNGVALIMEAIYHEIAHINNPGLSELAVENKATTTNVRAALNQSVSRMPIGKVLNIAQEYGLLEPNAYAYTYDIGDITWWAQQNITVTQLRIEFATRQTIRNLAVEQKYIVSLPSGIPTTGALSWWAEQLRDNVKTPEQVGAEFAQLAQSQPALIAQVTALRARPGAFLDEDAPIVWSIAASFGLLKQSNYSYTFIDYDIAWWANWGFLKDELTKLFSARQLIRTIAEEEQYRVVDTYGVMSEAALSYWSDQYLSGAMTEDQIRQYFMDNRLASALSADRAFTYAHKITTLSNWAAKLPGESLNAQELFTGISEPGIAYLNSTASALMINQASLTSQGKVLLLRIKSAERGSNDIVAQSIGIRLDENLGELVINKRVTLKDALEVARTAMETQKIRAIVTINEDAALTTTSAGKAVSEGLRALHAKSRILDVQSEDIAGNKLFVPEPAIYDLALRLGFDQDMGADFATFLSRIGLFFDDNGKPIDPLAMSAYFIIRIIPRAKAVDVNADAEAQALTKKAVDSSL